MKKKILGSVCILCACLTLSTAAWAADTKNAWAVCDDGVNRFFDENGNILRDHLTPDRIYVDYDGNPQDPADNNLNHILLKYASHGRRALGIDKSSHVMELWEDGEFVKYYMVTYGLNEGDKEVQGDSKTPDGFFYICQKRDVDSLLKGELGLNYPDISDARRGLLHGVISQATADSLIRSNRALQKPSWDTALGGAIEVHGNGQIVDATRGCVGVDDSEIYEVYNRMQVGDRVLICE